MLRIAIFCVSLLTIGLSAFALEEPHKYYRQWQNGLPADSNFFPIGVWLQDPSNGAAYRTAGINLYIGLWDGPTSQQLTDLSNVGMKAICKQNATGLTDSHNNVIVGWMHGDEPDNAQPDGSGGYGPCISPDTIIAGYQAVKKADATRPVYLNLGQGVSYIDYVGRGSACDGRTDMYPGYIQGCDIVSYDIYPVNSGYTPVSNNLWYVPKGVDSLKQWSSNVKPVWCWIETTRIDSTGQQPSPAQIKTEVWMALIHGANGFAYFCHSFYPGFMEAGWLNNSVILAAITAINVRVTSLAAVLNSPNRNILSVHSNNPAVPIDAVAKAFGGATYVFAASMRNDTSTATFTLSGITGAQSVTVLDESRTISMTGGVFKDTFAEYGVHLYQIYAIPPTTTAPSTPTLNSPADAAADQLPSLILSWNTVTGAVTYHVQVSTSNTFASIFMEDSTLVTTTRTVTGLPNSSVYYWRVSAGNAVGVSAWASAWSFTIISAAPATPVLALPTNAATGQSVSPALSWNAATGAATYHVQVSTSNTFALLLSEDSTLAATSKTITGLGNNLTCYWRVQAKNTGGVSAWASPWSFTTGKIGLFPVSAGWNMISLNIHPRDSSANGLLGPLHGFVFLKNNLGQIYWPAYGINTIGNLATGQGYCLYTDSADTIRTPGINAVSTPVSLAAGWSMIGYLPENDMPIATALSSVAAQITIVKNSRGDIYWPDYSISTIGNMKVGQGYRIHMKSGATLTYPASGKSLAGAHEWLAPPKAVHYLPNLNTGNTASLLSTLVAVDGAIAPDNDEIGAFDENGVLVGAGVNIHGIAAFPIWGDNARTAKKDGCTAAEKITFRLWDGARETPAEFEGSVTISYKEDGLFIGKLTASKLPPIATFALKNAFPNPFGDRVQILFDVPALGGRDWQDIDIAINDVRGRLVHQLAKGRYKANHYRVSWRGRNDKQVMLGCGVYIITMKANRFNTNLKLFKIK